MLLDRQLADALNKGDLDLIELVLMDAETGAVTKVESDPLGKVDFGGATFSEVTKELVATTYEEDRERIYWKDNTFEKDYNHIKKSLGDRDIAFQYSTKDESKWIVVTNSDVDPGTGLALRPKEQKSENTLPGT